MRLGIAVLMVYVSVYGRTVMPTQFSNIVSIWTDHLLCTGWVAKPGVFVTASHCFENRPTPSIFAEFIDGSRTSLTLVRAGNRFYQRQDDIAILTGDTKHQQSLVVVDHYKKSESCIGVGYSIGRQAAFNCISSQRKWETLGCFVGRSLPGDSGGPVINSNGEVIGMTVMYLIDGRPEFDVVLGSKLLEYLDAKP